MVKVVKGSFIMTRFKKENTDNRSVEREPDELNGVEPRIPSKPS